jgi:hypothetical protein
MRPEKARIGRAKRALHSRLSIATDAVDDILLTTQATMYLR